MAIIPLMDVARQYQTLQEEISASVLNVLASGKYIMGTHVAKFEKNFAEFIGVKHAISVGNGTDALVIALKAIGIQPGDEVITCAMSFFATAEAISILGATPVFVDCDQDTYTIDISGIEQKITKKTKAIIPVHLYGQCADMEEIMFLAQKYHLSVVEDAAQAAGATYKGKRAGTIGHIACFSFFPTKNLGCAGDGGMITTNNEDLARKCRAYRVHGSGQDGQYTYCHLNNNKSSLPQVSFSSDLSKYYNFVIGFNSRLDEIQAAILDIKLKYLEKWNTNRRILAQEYNHSITNKLIIKPQCKADREHIYYTYIIRVQEREKLRFWLDYNEINTGVYFPVPLHLQKVYEHLDYHEGDMPNAEHLANHSLAIPMFTEMTDEEQTKIINAINKFEG